jgi:hypothetical protein
MPIANCARPRVAAAHPPRVSDRVATKRIAAVGRFGAAGTILPPANVAGP